ncbi:NAD(P)H:quinone oxidoreductase [Microaceticoccus formicicus]|uniref:NAD(P)H:quinone oxidoreductase n=1 Tax=Microaceticoccus formicicus TaxID=3118105 RepID=UPI003CD00C76|nr:NAD(P)H:quinone oxidoreductase [Peptoniphilaceae bacterium AMB_02]
MTNLLIVYYSQTGHNFEMAKWAEDEAKSKGVNIRLRKVRELADKANMNPAWEKYLEDSQDIEEASSEDLEWADGILISTPTRFGIVPAQMKLFIDSQGGLWAEGKLTNKVVSAMTSAQNNNGGQEMTLMSIYASMMHWGAIIVPPGYTDTSIFKAGGNPYGTSGTATNEGFANDLEDAVRHQVSRLIEITKKFNE